jgi:hypothetical protein
MSGSSFPPPALGTGPLPPPSGSASFEIPVQPPAPRRRTGRVVAAVVAVLALVVGVAALLAARRDDAGSARSLDAALEQAAAAQGVAYRAEVGLDGETFMTMDAVVDRATERMRIDADVSGFLPGGGDAVTLAMVVDGAAGVVYLSADGLPLPAEWVQIDASRMEELTGQDLGDLTGQFGVSPLDVGDLLEPGTAIEIGTEDLEGAAVTRYRVTIDASDALAAFPELDASFGAAVPDELVYDVLVGDGDQLRRFETSYSALGIDATVVVDVESIGGPVEIAVPEGAVDLTDLGGLFGGD